MFLSVVLLYWLEAPLKYRIEVLRAGILTLFLTLEGEKSTFILNMMLGVG